ENASDGVLRVGVGAEAGALRPSRQTQDRLVRVRVYRVGRSPLNSRRPGSSTRAIGTESEKRRGAAAATRRCYELLRPRQQEIHKKKEAYGSTSTLKVQHTQQCSVVMEYTVAYSKTRRHTAAWGETDATKHHRGGQPESRPLAQPAMQVFYVSLSLVSPPYQVSLALPQVCVLVTPPRPSTASRPLARSPGGLRYSSKPSDQSSEPVQQTVPQTRSRYPSRTPPEHPQQRPTWLERSSRVGQDSFRSDPSCERYSAKLQSCTA
ncbi:unnamed protein product, partial [Hapterophycus canaliculatus]